MAAETIGAGENDGRNDGVVIELFRPDVDLLGSTSPLQHEAIETLDGFIKAHLKDLDPSHESCEANIYYPRFHRAILIKGGRGSGKTTFLINALSRLAGPEKDGGIPEVCVLPMIDPTLIETKDHIFLTILQMIEAKIDKVKVSDDEEELERLGSAREGLAGGLALLDGIGPKEIYGSGEWEDARWVMSDGLRKARKGAGLERKFNKYIECALKILGKKAFVLSFDDVDTNFACGLMILETMRKYLTSGHIILILSGDIDLYRRLVRKNIYDTFGQGVMTHDKVIFDGGEAALFSTVRELEEQYLLKVLPPQYRIQMRSLGELKGTVNVRLSQGAALHELRAWASGKIRDLLRERDTADSGTHPFVPILLAEPLRLVLGYLRALDIRDETRHIDKETTSRRTILQLFEGRLADDGLHELSLHADRFNHNLYVAFQWLVKHHEPSALISFFPNEDKEQAVRMHCLALTLADGLTDGGAVLRALFAFALPIAMTKQPRFSSDKLRQEVWAFLWRRGGVSLTAFTARLSAISRSADSRGSLRASVFGSVGVMQSGNSDISYVYGNEAKGLSFDELKNNQKEQATKKWLDKVEHYISKQTKRPQLQNIIWFGIDRLLSEGRCGAFHPFLNLVSHKSYSSNGEIQYSMSSLSLFAAIGELITKGDPESVLRDIDEFSVDDITPYFGEDGNQKGAKGDGEHILPYEGGKGEEDEDGDDSHEETDASLQRFLYNLNAWQEFVVGLGAKTTVSPAMLGQLANRIHDDLVDLDRTLSSESKMSGEILHRQIIVILNAVVTETVKLTGPRLSPKTSDVVFIQNLDRAAKSEQLHPLSVALLTCPLVWTFLDPQDQGDILSKKTLYDIVCDALGGSSSVPLPSGYGDWMIPPTVTVKLGWITKNTSKQMKVHINGFYDLLNVVPRYSPALK